MCIILTLTSLLEGEPGTAGYFFIAASAAAAIAALTNWGLVARNAAPVYDGGRVTVISHTLDKDVVIPRITVNNSPYICEDGDVKCANIALGDVVIGQKWAEDGWTWRFRPSQIEAAR